MVWFAVIGVVVLLGVALWFFDRWTREVESELLAEGMKSTPMFAWVRRWVEGQGNDRSGPNSRRPRS